MSVKVKMKKRKKSFTEMTRFKVRKNMNYQ